MGNDWEHAAGAVRRARSQRRWSIRDACAAAGLSPTTWINVEKGLRVSPLTQAAVAQALGWPEDAFDVLLAGEELPTPPPDAESWDDLKSSLSEEGRAAVRAVIEQLRSKQQR